uniref:Uncharacterized protein n=1 Tax=Oryza punctata TaxID=4537 RepID=A0A0E0LGQ6_ORYPU
MAAMALCSLARKGTSSPKTATPTGKGRASSFEEKNVEYFAELAKQHADEARSYRIVLLSAVSVSGVVFFTLLALRNHVISLSER